jgi:hypothetical protein
MKKFITLSVIAVMVSIARNGTPARAQLPDGGYAPLPHGGNVYQAPSGWTVPPYYSYRAYGYGYRPYYGWSLPPYGFGSPYYNGYNDPYYYSYGPGVRQFLRMGGANFYGW